MIQDPMVGPYSIFSTIYSKLEDLRKHNEYSQDSFIKEKERLSQKEEPIDKDEIEFENEIDNHIQEMNNLEKVFPNNIKMMIVLLAHSVFEDFLISICIHYDNNGNHLTKKLAELLKENDHFLTIDHCKSFIQKNYTLEIGTKQEWQFIMKIKELRNAIAHNSARILKYKKKKDENEKERPLHKSYISLSQLVKEYPTSINMNQIYYTGIADNQYFEIKILNNNFSEIIIQNYLSFFKYLENQLPDTY